MLNTILKSYFKVYIIPLQVTAIVALAVIFYVYSYADNK